MSKLILAAISLLMAVLIAGCDRPSADDSARADGRPLVVCTVAMIGDVASEIAGDHAEIVNLLGAGIDPHLYKPTRADVATLLRADLVLVNGLHLEGKMTEVLDRVASSGTPVVAVAEAIDPSLLIEPQDGAGQHDPHVWMDPEAWGQVAGVIAESLAATIPTQAETIESGLAEYRGRLDALHAYSETVLASVSESRRVLVTAHDAFGYFGRRYGFEVVGIQGLSTESEAGVRDIERIVALLVDRDIPAVFVESTVSERNVRALIEGAQSRGHAVTIGASLFSDAMGEAGTYEGTYIGMLDHNVTSIARALGGEAPSRGMDGRLRE